MAEEDPFQSREALADAQFEAAIVRHSNNDGCIQLMEDDKPSILHQNFPPLETTYSSSSIQKSPPHSSSSSYITGSTRVHSHLQTRAQRIKNGSKVTPLHEQKKLSKAAKREANALARTSKANPATSKHDPDVYQWNLLLADQPKRAEEAVNIQGNVEPVIAANPITTDAIICEDNH
ncbi:hypothetical protein LguiA_012690 [Lonicera macranthoides]